MYALLIIAIFTWLAYVVGGQAETNIELTKAYKQQRLAGEIKVISDNLNQYYLEKNSYPNGLAELAATQGFEHLRSSTNSNIVHVNASNLTDTMWTFNRFVLLEINPQVGETASSVGAINTCGSGEASSATTWCGRLNTLWERQETRENYNNQLGNQRIVQQRILHKFASYFNENQLFPNKDQNNANLVAGTAYKLATLVGYAGLASNCSGTFSWQNIPIDCGEMFDLWGNPVTYTYFNTVHIALISSTPFKNQGGTKVTIATDLDAS